MAGLRSLQPALPCPLTVSPCGPSKPETQPLPTTASLVPLTVWVGYVSDVELKKGPLTAGPRGDAPPVFSLLLHTCHKFGGTERKWLDLVLLGFGFSSSLLLLLSWLSPPLTSSPLSLLSYSRRGFTSAGRLTSHAFSSPENYGYLVSPCSRIINPNLPVPVLAGFLTAHCWPAEQ